MITKYFLNTTLFLILLAGLVSCDDDYQDIGSSLMPDEDDIFMYADQVSLTAKTVSLGSNLFVRTQSVMLGSLNDPTFGRVKGDFLGQLFVANARFAYGYKGLEDVNIDSVRLQLVYPNGAYLGDPNAPVGISVYEVNKDLQPNFYIDVKASDYCDKSILWGQRIFTEDDLMPVESGLAKLIEVDIDKQVGKRIFDRWVQDTLSNKKETILYNTSKFKEFIKGIYVTSSFNDKSLIKFADANSSIYLNIFYSYNIKSHDEKSDSIVYRSLPFPLGAEALLLNSIETPKYEDLEIFKNPEKGRTYMQSLSGIATEITIPLKKIKEKGIEKNKGKDFSLTSALFNVVGMTEEEDKLKLTDRPSTVLFINADSIKNYFYEGKKPDGKTSWTLTRYSSNNTYYFNTGAYLGATTKNIATMINYYLEEKPELDEVKYLMIPIEVTAMADPNPYSSATLISSVRNSFTPTAAILRMEESYLKMPLLFGRFADKEKPENKED